MPSQSHLISQYPRDRGILAGFRNKLINGNFSVTVRGTAFNIAAGSIVFVADRWTVYNRTNQPCTVNVWPSANFFAADGDYTPYMEVNFATAPTTGTVDISQPIENLYSLAGKQATFTFYTSASTTVTANLNVRYGTPGTASADDNITIPLTAKINSGGNVNKFTGLVNIPTVSGKTIAGIGHWVRPTIILTPRAAGGTYFAKASFVLGDATREFDPFSPRHIEQEIALCERYTKRITVRGLESSQFSGWWVQGATGYAPMRVQPTTSISVTYSALVGLPLTVDFEANGFLSVRSSATGVGTAEFLASVLLSAEL